MYYTIYYGCLRIYIPTLLFNKIHFRLRRKCSDILHSSIFIIHYSFFKYSDPLRGYKNLIILYYNIYFLGSEYLYKKINLFSSIFKENLHMYYDINKVTPHEKIAEELFLSG